MGQYLALSTVCYLLLCLLFESELIQMLSFSIFKFTTENLIVLTYAARFRA